MEPKKVEQIIKRHAFSGGKDTMTNYQMYGGDIDIDIDISYQYQTFFLESDEQLKYIAKRYTNRTMGSCEIKSIIAKIFVNEITNHQKLFQ